MGQDDWVAVPWHFDPEKTLYLVTDASGAPAVVKTQSGLAAVVMSPLREQAERFVEHQPGPLAIRAVTKGERVEVVAQLSASGVRGVILSVDESGNALVKDLKDWEAQPGGEDSEEHSGESETGEE